MSSFTGGSTSDGDHGSVADPTPVAGKASRHPVTDAFTRSSGSSGGTGTKYYTFEYTIKTDDWYRHNIAVFAELGGKLYTMVCQVPEADWKGREAAFRKTAESFRVFVPTG